MPTVSNVNDVIADRVVEHQIRILRTASEATAQVVALLQDCDNATFRAFGSGVDSEGLIAVPRIDALLTKVRKINADAYDAISNYLRSSLNKLAHYEVEFSEGLLDTHLPFSYRVARPPRAMTAAIVNEEPMLGGLLPEWIEGLANGRYERVRAQVRLGASAKESVLEVVRRIRGTKRLSWRDGISALTVRSARAMVMTVFNHVANKSRLDFFRANQEIISSYLWSAVLDDLTCEECAALDGNSFDPDEIDENPVPSVHLNCRCVLIPVIGEEVDEQVRCPPPRYLRYNDWLARQTTALQDEILGPARAAMFRRGMKLSKFTDASGTRHNLSELRLIEAKAMAPKKSAAAKQRKGAKVLKNYGWKPDLPDQRDHLYGAVRRGGDLQLPVRVSLRDKMPPVFDQGTLGSCVANAGVAAHMFVHEGEEMMSRLDLYYMARYLEGLTEEDSGCQIRDAVKALAKFGVCTETTWPYQIRKFATDPPDRADQEALQYRITSYLRLSSLQDFQQCLAAGYPIIFGMSLYSNFYDPQCEKGGILALPPKDSTLQGGHAMLAIGYDADFHSNPVFKRSGLSEDNTPSLMFEVRNSWGASWGDAGHLYVPADYLNSRDLSDDFWTVRT